MVEVVLLSKAHAAIFILRFNLHPAYCAVVDDKRIHAKHPPMC